MIASDIRHVFETYSGLVGGGSEQPSDAIMAWKFARHYKRTGYTCAAVEYLLTFRTQKSVLEAHGFGPEDT